MKFGVVDLMENKGLMREYGIRTAPSIKVFGEDKSDPEDYSGGRQASDIVSFINEYATEGGFVDVDPRL